MDFQIYKISKPSKIKSLYEAIEDWVGYIEDESRAWWVAFEDTTSKIGEFIHDGICSNPPNIPVECNMEWLGCLFDGEGWAGFAGIHIDKAAQIAIMTPCEVKENYRGHGLQRKFLKVREDWCRLNGYQKAFSLTSTTNIESANNLIAMGYRLRKPFVGVAGHGLYWEKILS